MPLSPEASRWFDESGINPDDPRWAGYDPTSDPRYSAFQSQQATLGPIMHARTAQDWLRAMEAKPDLTQGERDLMARVRSQPDRYEIRGGSPSEKPNWLERNLWWMGPAAIVGGSALPLAFGGGGAAGGAAGSAAAGGVLPSSSLPASVLMGGPAAVASQGVSAGIPFAAGTGAGAAAGAAGGAAAGAGGSAAQDIAKTVAGGAAEGLGSNAVQAALAALAGLPGLLANKGPSDEEKRLMEQSRQLAALQQRRIEHQNPLYEAVTRLAMSRQPTAVQQPMQPL